MTTTKWRSSSFIKAKVPVIDAASGLLLCLSISGAIIILAWGAPLWPGIRLSIGLAIVLTLYLVWEIRRELRRGGAIALLSPPVLASMLHFFLSYAAPILAIQLTDDFCVRLAAWSGVTEPAELINLVMYLVIGCAIALWFGYRSMLARSGAEFVRAELGRMGFIRHRISPNMPVLILMGIVSLLATLTEIRLGVFGYSSNYDALFGQAQYRQLLASAADMMGLCLFLIAVSTFRGGLGKRRHTLLYPLMLSIFALQVTTGFLTGFKGAVVMPGLIVTVAYYIVHRRIPKEWVLISIALIFMAYAVVEPFRVLRNQNANFDSTSLSAIAGTVVDAASQDHSDSSSGAYSTATQFVNRFELVSVTGTGIHYAATRDGLGPNAPSFLGSLLAAPFVWFIPRALWSGKPIYQFGLWFAQTVLDDAIGMRNSVGMGPISYFYFIGGPFACLVGFFLFGVFMRLLYQGLTPLGAGGWIMYLSVTSTLAVIPGEVGPAFAGIFQSLFFSAIAQWLALRPEKIGPSGKRSYPIILRRFGRV